MSRLRSCGCPAVNPLLHDQVPLLARCFKDARAASFPDLTSKHAAHALLTERRKFLQGQNQDWRQSQLRGLAGMRPGLFASRRRQGPERTQPPYLGQGSQSRELHPTVRSATCSNWQGFYRAWAAFQATSAAPSAPGSRGHFSPVCLTMRMSHFLSLESFSPVPACPTQIQFRPSFLHKA